MVHASDGDGGARCETNAMFESLVCDEGEITRTQESVLGARRRRTFDRRGGRAPYIRGVRAREPSARFGKHDASGFDFAQGWGVVRGRASAISIDEVRQATRTEAT